MQRLEMQLEERQEDLAAARQHMEFSKRVLSETQAEAQCELANLEDALQVPQPMSVQDKPCLCSMILGLFC